MKLVELLEENILEPPLHQLSLSEFNLHLEAKKERLKQVGEVKLFLQIGHYKALLHFIFKCTSENF